MAKKEERNKEKSGRGGGDRVGINRIFRRPWNCRTPAETAGRVSIDGDSL